MSYNYEQLDEIDPSKLDVKLDVRDLSREIIFTVRVLDDKTFSVISKEALNIFNELKREMANYKKTLP